MYKPATLLASLLIAVAFPAGAAPYAPEEHDFSDRSSLEAALCGVVEGVREVILRAEPVELADVFEHAVRAETGEALVVRLDDGRLIVVVQEAMHFRPGERVRLVTGGRRPRLERV